MKDRTIGIFFFMLFIGNVALAAAGYAYNTTAVQPTWNRQIKDPFEQAQNAQTFQLAMQELNITIQGMHNLGLLSSDYNTVFSWDQTPQNSMAWQYTQLNALIARGQTYITLNSQGNVTQLSDVYQQRLYNFRSEMGATIQTDSGVTYGSTATETLIQIAYQDYLIRYAPVIYWQWYIALAVIIFDVAAFFGLTMFTTDESQERPTRPYSLS